MNPDSISQKRPWISQSLAVNRKDVKAANEHAKSRGFVHRYDEKTGRATATSERGRRDAMKMQNTKALEGGYSDWCGN